MVRIKERYLLVSIIYPPEPAGSRSLDPIALHRPTLDKLTPQALLRAIRAQVALLFGDYGSGAFEGHLSGSLDPLAQHTDTHTSPRPSLPPSLPMLKDSAGPVHRKAAVC